MIRIRRGFEISGFRIGIKAITTKIESESKTLSMKTEGSVFEIAFPSVRLIK